MNKDKINDLADEFDDGARDGWKFSEEALLEFARALLAAGASEGQADRKLDKPAQVSHTSFGVGVSWSTVIGAAQRHFEYRNDKSVPRSYPDRYNIREIDALKLFPVDQSSRQFVDYTQYLTLQREYEATFAEIAALRERIAGMEKDAEQQHDKIRQIVCDWFDTSSYLKYALTDIDAAMKEPKQ